jgi:hypothetical protein
MRFISYFNFDASYSGSSTNGMIYYCPGSGPGTNPGEVFSDPEDGSPLPEGYYWIAGLPGCLFDGEPVGPFASEADALEDAQW